MYFFLVICGKGLVKKLVLKVMEEVREMGFKCCYLEMIVFLKEVIGLYEYLGF